MIRSLRRWAFARGKKDPKQKGRPQDANICLPRTADFSFKSCQLNGSPPIIVRYWPHFSNPYQSLFYGFDSETLSAKPGDAETTLREVESNPDKSVCFHVHWLNLLFSGARKQGGEHYSAGAFLDTCALIREKGGIIAWTVHNLIEHETSDRDLEMAFRRKLAALADIIIVHSKRAAEEAKSAYNAPSERIIIAAHGSYIGVYDDEVGPEAARKRVGCPSRETIFANIGIIRPYKGLDKLVPSILALEQEGLSVGLLVAGRVLPHHGDLISSIPATSSAIVTNIGHIDNADMQYYLNAADFIVLPYTATLTSGAAILAMSFGRPVIAPALGGLSELIDDEQNGFLYDPTSPDGLTMAMRRAAMTDAATRARMSGASFARATGLRWSDGRAAFISAIRCRHLRRRN